MASRDATIAGLPTEMDTLPVLLPGQSATAVSRDICGIVLSPPGLRWWIGFAFSGLLVLMLLSASGASIPR